LLYRLEQRGWIKGRWVEKEGQRRRRFYRLTPEGRRMLAAQRDIWREFVEAINRITGAENA
jgi:DNA-binding PadR family transcriptional regulator